VTTKKQDCPANGSDGGMTIGTWLTVFSGNRKIKRLLGEWFVNQFKMPPFSEIWPETEMDHYLLC
jgi:hypothetical protein